MDSIYENYEPGVCNIGVEERSRRRLLGWISFAIVVITYVLGRIFNIPRIYFLLEFLPSFSAILAYFQVTERFCAYFGIFNYFNFEKIGEQQNVTDIEAQSIDRLHALQMFFKTMILSIIVTAALFYL